MKYQLILIACLLCATAYFGKAALSDDKVCIDKIAEQLPETNIDKFNEITLELQFLGNIETFSFQGDRNSKYSTDWHHTSDFQISDTEIGALTKAINKSKVLLLPALGTIDKKDCVIPSCGDANTRLTIKADQQSNTFDASCGTEITHDLELLIYEIAANHNITSAVWYRANFDHNKARARQWVNSLAAAGNIDAKNVLAEWERVENWPKPRKSQPSTPAVPAPPPAQQ